MTVRAKALCILALALGGLAALSYALARSIVLRGFRAVEEADARAHLARVVGAIRADSENLRAFVIDWAWWDDTYGFVRSRDPAFLAANVVPAVFQQSRLRAILFLDLDGAVIGGHAYDRAGGTPVGIPDGLAPLLGPLTRAALTAEDFQGVEGVLCVPGERLVLAAVPIVDTDGEGPPRGVLLMARALDREEVLLLRERVHLSFSLGDPRPEAAAGPAVRPLSAQDIVGYAQVPDVFGTPALGVELHLPRTIYQKGVWTVAVLVTVLVAGGVLLIAVAWSLLDRTVLAPIGRLGAGLRAIRASGDAGGRVPEFGGDEVGLLAADVNRTLEALETSQRDLREKERLGQAAALLDGLPAYAYLKDARGRYVLGNRRFCEAVGRAPGGVTGVAGMADRDLLPEADAARLESRDGLALAGGEPVASTAEAFHDGGREVVVSARTVPLRDAEGRVTGVAGLLFDVTELARARERLARLVTAVEQTAEAIVVTDTRGIIQYVNPGFERHTGYLSVEAVGRDIRILESGKHDPTHYATLWETLARGDPWSGRFIQRRKDGSLYEAECTISPVREGDGRVVSYVSVQRDVTREASLERQLRQAQKLEALGTLAGGIAHDFNNALTPILLGAEMVLREVPEGGRAQRLLRQVVSASERARDLVGQILTFSRQGEQERRVVSVTPILKETLKLMRATLPSSLEIRERLAASQDRVLGDPAQLHQVLVNLLTNAGQAVGTEPGSVWVATDTVAGSDLPAGVQHPDRPHLRIAVADTGCGMDDEVRERMFEPFFTTRPPGQGTGLGLSVVHGIVTGCGGAIQAESAPGHGALLQVFLPVAEEVPAAESLASGEPVGGHERVLLVEDEPATLDTMAEFLASLGYRVTPAGRPSQALAHFAADPGGVDLVVADQTMPEMSGLDLIARCRERRPGLAAVLVSGRGGEPAAGGGAGAGGVLVLAKPVGVAALAGAVRAALDGAGSAAQ